MRLPLVLLSLVPHAFIISAQAVIEDFTTLSPGERVIGKSGWSASASPKEHAEAMLFKPGKGNDSPTALRIEGLGNEANKDGPFILEKPFANPGYKDGETIHYSFMLHPLKEAGKDRISDFFVGLRTARGGDQPMATTQGINPEGLGPMIGFSRGGSGSMFAPLDFFPGRGGKSADEKVSEIRSETQLQIGHWYEVRLVIRPNAANLAKSTATVYARDLTLGETDLTYLEGLKDVPVNFDNIVKPANLSAVVIANKGLAEIGSMKTGLGGEPAEAKKRRQAWELITKPVPERPAGPPRTYVVNRANPKADDSGEGTEEAPLRTINAAAQLAGAGDTVLVHAGVYREWVKPLRSGEEGKPVIYTAAPGETVTVKGSVEWKPDWQPVADSKGVYQAALTPELFDLVEPMPGGVESLETGKLVASAPGWENRYNPFAVRARGSRGSNLLGQVFVDGRLFKEASAKLSKEEEEALGKPDFDKLNSKERKEAEQAWKTKLGGLQTQKAMQAVAKEAETFAASGDGTTLFVHFPEGTNNPGQHQVEISTRYHVFAPLRRGAVNHLHMRGFTFEHCANQPAFPQEGMVSTRSGTHWVIEENTIRWANAVGLDIGQEHYMQDDIRDNPVDTRHTFETGWHVVRNNIISDNGQLGLGGYGAQNTKVIGNLIERNGHKVPGAESAAIKFHGSLDSVFEGNLVRDNGATGIWLDTSAEGSRVTRNLCINNVSRGIFVELTFGPVLVDNNVILFNQGDGFYSHDASDVTLTHNLIVGNSAHGALMMIATDRTTGHTGPSPRKAESSGMRIYNNIFIDNPEAVLSLPQPSPRVRENLSDSNVIGAGGAAFIYSRKNGTGADHELVLEEIQRALGEIALRQVPSGFALTLEQWQRVTGLDKQSTVAEQIRAEFSRESWQMKLIAPEALPSITKSAVDKVDVDYLGNPLSVDPLPGPFQDIKPGENSITLWPIPEIGNPLQVKPTVMQRGKSQAQEVLE